MYNGSVLCSEEKSSDRYTCSRLSSVSANMLMCINKPLPVHFTKTQSALWLREEVWQSFLFKLYILKERKFIFFLKTRVLKQCISVLEAVPADRAEGGVHPGQVNILNL